MKTPKEYLEHYHQKYKIDFRVQHWSTGPQPWTNYGTPEYKEYITDHQYVNHREILPDEIVIDIDIHGEPNSDIKKHKTEKLARTIYNNIINQNITASLWKSGGDGCHIHMFFPQLLNENKTHRTALKKMLRKHFGKGYLRVPDGEAHVCQGNPILIQLELAKHRKGGIKTLLENKDFGTNQIPHKIMYYFQENKKEYKNKRLFNLNPDTPKAIQFLENEDFSSVADGRARALFILACYYGNFMDEAKLYQKLDKWNRYQLRGHLSYKQIKSTIRSVLKKKKQNNQLPLFPYNYLRDLMDELGFDVDYSDLSFISE